MKNNSGISLIALIVTIIVIIILAGTVVYVGISDNLVMANNAKIYNDMSELRDAVSQRALENRIDSGTYPIVGTPLSDYSPEEVGGVTYGDGWYVISSETDKEELNMRELEGEYIVNYSSNEVVSKTVIKYKGEEYYALSDFSSAMTEGNGLYIVQEYDDVKGVNKPVLTAGMIPVKSSGGSYVVCDEADLDWYNYSGDSQVWATVMLLDDLEVEKNGVLYSNEDLKEMSLDEIVGAKVIVEGSSFVWIPRYSYKEDNGEISIVYSHLLSDYLRDGYTKHPAFYFGEYTGASASGDANRNTGYVAGGEELTGIWISKYGAEMEY